MFFVSLSDPYGRRAERPAAAVSDIRFACASMSPKPCPAYAISVRRSEIRAGDGRDSVDAPHGVLFAASLPSLQHRTFWWLTFELGFPYHRVWV